MISTSQITLFWEQIRGFESMQDRMNSILQPESFRACIRMPKGKPIGIFRIELVINLARMPEILLVLYALLFQLWNRVVHAIGFGIIAQIV